MTQVRRCSNEEFQRLPLAVHQILADVPVRDITVVELSGGGEGRTLSELRDMQSLESMGGPLARSLFALRFALGRWFGWDEDRPEDHERSYAWRLPKDLIARSRHPPGTPSGPFQILYDLDDEALLEIRNATVHAFLSSVLIRTGGGYRLYWAVYVLPVSWITPVYMALIEPFRRFVVYPSLLRALARAWQQRYATAH